MLQEKSEKTKNPSFISLELSNTTVKAPGTQEETSKKLQEGTKHIEQIDIPIELKIGAFSLILHSGFDKDDLLSILEVLKESC